jgi:hypothetical protein
VSGDFPQLCLHIAPGNPPGFRKTGSLPAWTHAPFGNIARWISFDYIILMPLFQVLIYNEFIMK